MVLVNNRFSILSLQKYNKNMVFNQKFAEYYIFLAVKK